MTSAHEIRRKVALVSTGKLSLNAFEDWFVPNSWNVHKSGSQETIDLVSAIHLMLSERDDALLNEPSLRKRLSSLLKPETVIVKISEVPEFVREFQISDFQNSAPATLLPAVARL